MLRLTDSMPIGSYGHKTYSCGLFMRFSTRALAWISLGLGGIELEGGEPVDGILGADALSMTAAVIDYSGPRLRIGAPASG